MERDSGFQGQWIVGRKIYGETNGREVSFGKFVLSRLSASPPSQVTGVTCLVLVQKRKAHLCHFHKGKCILCLWAIREMAEWPLNVCHFSVVSTSKQGLCQKCLGVKNLVPFRRWSMNQQKRGHTGVSQTRKVPQPCQRSAHWESAF